MSPKRETVDVTMAEVTKNCSIGIRLRGRQRWEWRTWLGMRILRFACWVMPVDTEIDIRTTPLPIFVEGDILELPPKRDGEVGFTCRVRSFCDERDGYIVVTTLGSEIEEGTTLTFGRVIFESRARLVE